MNKITKLLSVFVIAGAIGTGVAGVAGCTAKDSHTHKWEYSQISGDAENHTAHCTADGHTGGDKTEGHTWSGDECSKCHYPKPAEGVVAPASATGIMTEWDGGLDDITLSESATTASIDLTKLKVYYKNGSTKGDAVPAANYTVTVNKDGDEITTLTGLKQGHYEIVVELTGVTTSGGSAANWDNYDELDILNPAKANSLALKSGTTTQEQSVTDSISDTWTFEVTLANGDKQSVEGVKITGVDTSVAGDNKEASVSVTVDGVVCTGKVTYTITANANLKIQSYAYNFGNLTTSGAYSNDTYVLDTKDTDHSGTYILVPASSSGVQVETNKPRESVDGEKYFTSRIKFGGGTYKSDGAFDSDTSKKKYIEIKTESAGKITVYWSRNSSSDNRGIALWKKDDATAVNIGSASKDSKAEPYDLKGSTGNATPPTQVPIGIISNVNTTSKELNPEMATFNVPEAGTYYLTTATNQDAYVYYIQIDNSYTDGSVENVPLNDGEKALASVAVSHTTEDYKQKFTVGDTFSVDSGYSVKGTYITANTAKKTEEAITDGITYWLGATQLTPGTTALTADLLGTLGEKTITVKVGEETVTGSYKISVDSAVAGITGVTATVKSTVVKQVEADDGKVTLNKTDIEVAKVGTNDEATVSAYTVKYRLASADAGTETEITDSVELGIGEYKLVVSATVSVTGGASADFTVEIDFNVTKKPGDGELQAVTITFHVKDTTVEGDTAHAVLSLAGNTVSSVIFDEGNSASVRTQNSVGCYNTSGNSLSSSKFSKRYITVMLKQAGTYTIAVTAKTSAASRHVAIGENTTANATVSSTEVANGSFNETTFESITITGTTLLIGADANIDISQIVITPVA